ncbi:MAG: OmpA family protein [Alphaproteobacteria bacterium]|nr:OmpA family protein [Alphaproteobacteria bacterium]
MTGTQHRGALALAFLLALGLSACTSLDTLRSTPLPQDGFQARLAADYRSFAEHLASRNNWTDSEYFAAKGLAAARGQAKLPDTLSRWPVSEADGAALTQARADVLALLNAETIRLYPGRTAHLIFLFDCWAQQVSSREVGGYSCKEEFTVMLANLRQKLAGAVAPQATPAQQERLMERHTIYFDYDLSTLKDDAKRTVAGVVSALGKVGDYFVQLTGHTDRSGTNRDYNHALSEVRAQAVKAEMMRLGVPGGKIATRGAGDTQPVVPTPDGQREEKNRRVEIDVQHVPAPSSVPHPTPATPATTGASHE